MSLFSLKTTWQYQPQSLEEFDKRHLAIGTIDQSNQQRLCLGSYSGILRIFKIASKFKETDLLFQHKYPQPIVAVKTNTQTNPSYSQTDKSVHLLFIKKIVILSFNYSNSTLTINKSLEFIPPSPCFTFFCNPLVSVSLNSELHFLNPPSTISIKVSQPVFSCVLGEDNNFYYADGEDFVVSKSGIQQLRILLGQIMDMHIINDRNGIKLLCVGEKAYWIVGGDGVIQETKRVDGDISCSLLLKTSTSFNIVLGTFTKLILIYNQGRLIWAAKSSFIPISINTMTVNSKKGILCLLSDTGSINICHLGMQQSTQTIEPLASTVDIKQIQSQIGRLQSQLRNKSKNLNQQKSVQSLKISFLNCRVEWSDDYIEDQQKYFQVNGKKRVLILNIMIDSSCTLYDVNLELKLPSNMHAEQKRVSYDEIRGSKEQQLKIYLFVNRFPYAQNVQLVASYFATSLRRQLNSTYLTVPIPFSLQAVRTTPKLEKQKNSHKIVLHANKNIPKLSELFADVEMIEQTPNQMQISFLISSNIFTTILASKHTSKYKLSSNFYEGLWIVILEFIKRVKKIGIQLTVQSVPLQELFVISEKHFKVRKELASLKILIEQSSQQFRLIQKKILTKIKDKNCDLTVLQELLSICCNNSISLCNQYEQLQFEMSAINHQLMISVLIVSQLLFLRGKVSKQARKMIEGILRVEEKGKYSEDWSWEHQVLVNSSLLQNKKINREQLQTVQFQRVRKVLIWLVDKTAKGEIK